MLCRGRRQGRGIARPHWREAVRAGLIFGCIEATTPIVGWARLARRELCRGLGPLDRIRLLGALGVKMIREGLQAADEPAENGDPALLWMLALTGFATSIDAMAVGVGLAFLDVAILPVAATIGSRPSSW
jgi:putative Mn2+ efflux pump MntP